MQNNTDIVDKCKELKVQFEKTVKDRIDGGGIQTINEECNVTVGYVSALHATYGETYWPQLSTWLIPYLRNDSIVGHKYHKRS